MLEFAAQPWLALQLCGVTSVIFLEQDGSYIPGHEHQEKKAFGRTKGKDSKLQQI